MLYVIIDEKLKLWIKDQISSLKNKNTQIFN